MAQQVVSSAVTQCSFGSAPSSLSVMPIHGVLSKTPCANILDNVPMLNIMPFGNCSSILNPVVASATAAAQGVLTPMPCLPVTPTPWASGSADVKIGGLPALNNASKCMCSWGGEISITNAGQVGVNIS